MGKWGDERVKNEVGYRSLLCANQHRAAVPVAAYAAKIPADPYANYPVCLGALAIEHQQISDGCGPHDRFLTDRFRLCATRIEPGT